MSGRLMEWTIDRAIASGLDGIAHGALVDIDGAGAALVTALRSDRVELAPLSPRVPRSGAEVRSIGPLVVPTGTDLVGRVLDCLGRPLDGAGGVSRDDVERVFARDPVVIERAWRRLTVGALVYDLQRVVGMGVSLLAAGPRAVLQHVLRHQVASGRIVIVATPASASSDHRGPWHAQPGNTGYSAAEPARRIHVAAERNATAAQQWLVPWSALAIASGLRAQGHDVVVAIDHLEAWIPHARAFPSRGSWQTQLAQLASRAYARRSGSVSVIAMTREVSATRALAFDEILDLSIGARGELPLTGTKLVQPPIRVRSMPTLGRACSAAARLTAFDAIGRMDAPQAIPTRDHDEAHRIRECLRVRVGGTIDSLEQELCLLAVASQTALAPDTVTDFIDAYLTLLRRDHGGALAAIRAAGRMSADDEHVLLAAATEVASSATMRDAKTRR